MKNEITTGYARIYLVRFRFTGAFTNCKSILTDKRNTVYLSVTSIWEMQIKSQLERLTLRETLPEIVEHQRTENQMQLLSVLPEHIYTLSQLPYHHRDPFDRMLIAQATYESMTLVTIDRQIQKYDVTTLW